DAGTGSTSSANSASSVACGSSESPVCTAEGWMIVLEGATSHPNRSDAGSAAIASPSGSPAATRTRASRWARTSSAEASGASAASRRSSSPTLTPRNPSCRQNRTTPALKHSPRSTRGTTRRIAYENGLRRSACTIGLFDEDARRLQPQREILDVRARRVADEPVARDERRDPLERAAVELRCQSLVCRGDRAGARQQDVLCDLRERACCPLGGPQAGVLQVQRRPVVDQPEPLVPDEQVRVPRGAVDV